MKKTLCALLMLLCAACPNPAYAEPVVYEGAFSIDPPDGWIFIPGDWESEEDSIYAGFIAGEDGETPIIYIDLFYYEEYKGRSLSEDAPEDRDAYKDEILTSFEEYDPVRLESEWRYTSAQQIPFVCLDGKDSEGNYLYAETLINGWAVTFECYAITGKLFIRTRPLTDEEKAIFDAVIESFVMTAQTGEQFDALLRKNLPSPLPGASAA